MDEAFSCRVINLSTVHIQVNTLNMDLQSHQERLNELKKEKTSSIQTKKPIYIKN